MSFYNPQSASPDFGGGLQDLLSQFMMMKMISAMYPGEKGKKGEKETLRGMPKIGEMFLGETSLPPAQEMPPGLPMGQMGQSQMGQPQPGNIQQILQMLQMLGGLPGLMR